MEYTHSILRIPRQFQQHCPVSREVRATLVSWIRSNVRQKFNHMHTDTHTARFGAGVAGLRGAGFVMGAKVWHTCHDVYSSVVKLAQGACSRTAAWEKFWRAHVVEGGRGWCAEYLQFLGLKVLEEEGGQAGTGEG